MTSTEAETEESTKQKDCFLSQKFVFTIPVEVTFEVIEMTVETEVQVKVEKMRESIELVQQRLQSNEMLRNARSRNDDNCIFFRSDDVTED